MVSNVGPSWRELFEKEAAVVYVLDESLRFIYFNSAWDRFASENGGVGLEQEHWLGRSILEAIPPILQGFYSAAYRKVMKSSLTWNHSYECSTPERQRLCEMVAYPHQGQAAPGVVVANFVRTDLPRPSVHPQRDRGLSGYHDADGFVVMCANCRRSQRPRRVHEWDWVPEFVEHPPAMVSHGLCHLCAHHYMLIVGGEFNEIE